MSPLHQVAVSRPVGVVAGVQRKMVSDAVAPAVCFFRLFDFSVIVVRFEINACIIYFEVRAVHEVREPFLCSEVRLDKRLEIECLSVEFTEIVVVRGVACAEVVADPVFVVEIDVGGDAVVQKIKLRGDGSCQLLSRSSIARKVQFGNGSAFEGGLEK